MSLATSRWQRTLVSLSHVSFRRLRTADIELYCASGEPCGKAGAYAIQGRGAAFIRDIEGSYSGIMGLPLFETARLLKEAGIVPPGPEMELPLPGTSALESQTPMDPT